MAERSARLAVFAACGISRRDHRDHHPDDLVYHLKCAFGRTCESQFDDESGKGAVVLPRLTGNASLFRSVDCRGGDAHAHYLWLDGDSLHRYEPAGRGVLHLEAAQVCDWHISFWIHCPVGFDDYHRDFYSGTRMAMVLARADMGPQPIDL